MEISKTERKHVITYADGTKRKARLFELNGLVYEFIPHSTRRGRMLDTRYVVDITPEAKHTDEVAQAFRFIKKVCGYLEKSTLWPELLHDFKILLTVDNETMQKLLSDKLSYDENLELCKSLGMINRNGGVDSLKWTVKKGIKSINYQSWDKDTRIKEFQDAVTNKKPFSHSWRKGYDNSLSFMEDYGRMLAHYSEEYKNCGNGHYYLAIDAQHAIFCEDD